MPRNFNMAQLVTQYKILIVGGAGYVGGYLSDLLKHVGHSITVYDNLTYEERYMKNIPFIYGDIRDFDKLGKLINNYDIIIWLAALVGDEACDKNKLVSTDINYNTVKWLVNNYQGKIIYMSTCSIYGLNNDLLNEAAPANPLSHYALTKFQAEQEISNHNKNHLIFRLGTLFGLGDRYSRVRLDLVVNRLAKRAAFNQPLLVFGGGQWRPLLHVKDVAHAVLFGIQNNIYGLYNLSYQNYKICDIAEQIKKNVPRVVVNYWNLKFEDLRDYRVSAEKFLSLGWRPKYNLDYGIREIYQIMKDARIKHPDDIIYSNAEYIKSKII